MISGCTSDGEKKTDIYVFAAASLTECFEEIKETYEKEHPDVNIVLNFAGSQILANQILEGARSDMFFSANTKYVDLVIDDETIMSKDKTIFAGNSLILLINKDIPITSFEEVFHSNNINPPVRSIVLAHKDVPVGQYTLDMLNAYLMLTKDQEGYVRFFDLVVSYENDVKAVLAKVTMKQVDMGIVYRSDAYTLDEQEWHFIEVPEAYNQKVEYVSIKLGDLEVDDDLYEYITNGPGQEIIQSYGFN